MNKISRESNPVAWNSLFERIFTTLLISLLVMAFPVCALASYSIELATGYSDNADRQRTAQSSVFAATTIGGLWSLEPDSFIPVQLEATFGDVHYTAGGSSQQLDLGTGLRLWHNPSSELTLYNRLHYYQNSRLPADDFRGVSMTLLALTERPPFLVYLAQDLHWSDYQQGVTTSINTESKGPNRHDQNQGPATSEDTKRRERTLRSRLGVDLQVTSQFALNSSVSYADNHSSLHRERWQAHGWSLGLSWWPRQHWQGQLFWQQLETSYSRTVITRDDHADTVSFRLDYHPGSWQYYARWQWQRNKSSLAIEEFREQDITCGVIYHF